MVKSDRHVGSTNIFVGRSIGDTKIRRRQSRKCEQRVIGDRRSLTAEGRLMQVERDRPINYNGKP